MLGMGQDEYDNDGEETLSLRLTEEHQLRYLDLRHLGLSRMSRDRMIPTNGDQCDEKDESPSIADDPIYTRQVASVYRDFLSECGGMADEPV